MMRRILLLTTAAFAVSASLVTGIGSPASAGAGDENDPACFEFDPATMLTVTHQLVGTNFTFSIGVKDDAPRPCLTNLKFGAINTANQQLGQGGGVDTDTVWDFWELDESPYPVTFTVPCNFEAFLGYGGDPDTVDYPNLTFIAQVQGNLGCAPGSGVPETGNSLTLALVAAALVAAGAGAMLAGRRRASA